MFNNFYCFSLSTQNYDTSRRGSKVVSQGKNGDHATESPRRSSVATITGSSGLTGSGLGGRIDTGVVKYTPRLDGDSVDDLGSFKFKCSVFFLKF